MKLDPELMLQDITEQLSGLSQEDRVYRTASGFVVKVKALLDTEYGGQHGNVARVWLSGSICGEDGKALRREDDRPAVWNLLRSHHFLAHGEDDAEGSLNMARAMCAADTVRAEKTHRVLNSHTEGAKAGLVTLAQHQQRKAAEAAQEKPS